MRVRLQPRQQAASGIPDGIPSEAVAQAVLGGLLLLGGATRSLRELARASSLPLPAVTRLLRGSDGRSGLEGFGLVRLRRTRYGGLEVALSDRGLEIARGGRVEGPHALRRG